jgi:hypothetical protein
MASGSKTFPGLISKGGVLQEMDWRYVPLPMATTAKPEKHGTIG